MKTKLLGFYLDAFLANTLYFIPIYSVLFYQSIGFSLSQIGILIGVVSFSGLLSEIPTGIVADKIGRKKSVLIGYMIITLSYLLIYFFPEFWLIFMANVILGFGVTFISGAEESWKSDLVKKGLSGFFSRLQSIESAGAVIAGLIGVALVAHFGLSIIWLAGALSYFAGGIFLAMVPASNKSVSFDPKEYLSHLKNSFFIVKSNKVLRRYMFAIALLGFAYAFTTNLAWVPFLEGLGFEKASFGFIWSIMSLVGIGAPFLGQYILKRSNENRSMAIMTGLWILCLLSLFFISSIIPALIVLVLTLVFDEGRLPIQQAYLQERLPNKEKSTITSMESLLLSLGLVIGFPIAGVLADAFSPKFILLVSAFLLLPVMFLFSKEK
jgi:MFS family permease